MNYNLTIKRAAAPAKFNLNLHSLGVMVAALGCAFMVDATDIDYTYPLQLFLEGFVTEASMITDISTR
ncbi:hypothetical protein [Pontibacter sp. H249]|uniref:hypothetical protein n=1 Tax=Pontibacter sp. H249 TaxID=3133420 RepID=UPI0030C22034